MPSKDPLNYSLLTYAWVMFLALFGGCASFMQKVKTGTVHRFSITEFVGELVISGFAGLMTFFLCEAGDFQPSLSAVMIGMAGHMGSRAIFLLEQWLKSRKV